MTIAKGRGFGAPVGSYRSSRSGTCWGEGAITRPVPYCTPLRTETGYLAGATVVGAVGAVGAWPVAVGITRLASAPPAGTNVSIGTRRNAVHLKRIGKNITTAKGSARRFPL